MNDEQIKKMVADFRLAAGEPNPLIAICRAYLKWKEAQGG